MHLPDDNLWRAFQPGSHLVTESAVYEVTILQLDPLTLPSGCLAVGDPLVGLYYDEPLSKRVQPGRYSVRLVTAAGLDGATLSMVRFGPGTPTRWEPTEPEHHSVDSGCSGLIDHKVARRVQRRSEAWFERFITRCTDAMQIGTEPWAKVRLDQETGGNLLLFHTADGDGAYPSFWGYTDAGELVCLVTDFFLEGGVTEVRLGHPEQ